MSGNKKIKAVGLLSGGLDSTLALKVVQDQEIDIVALNFATPFCQCDKKEDGCKKRVFEIAKQLNIELKIIGLGQEYIEMVKQPKYGYGSNLNPCIDCRIMTFKKAKEFMEQIGASFIITGEVLGQRPMSQNRKSMSIIEKETGLEGYILRPLSAKFFEPTVPEKMGWVDRDKLLNIEGRSRRKQYELVKEYNLTQFGCPGGGCLLTDPYFSRVFKDLIKSDMFNIENVNLVKNGRYFSLSKDLKLISGRDEKENNIILNFLKEDDVLIEPDGLTTKGPTGLLRGKIKDKYDIILAAKIIAYYSKSLNGEIKLNVKNKFIGIEQICFNENISELEIENYRVK